MLRILTMLTIPRLDIGGIALPYQCNLRQVHTKCVLCSKMNMYVWSTIKLEEMEWGKKSIPKDLTRA